MGLGDRGALNTKVTGVYLESVGATEDAEQGTRWIGQWRGHGHTPVNGDQVCLDAGQLWPAVGITPGALGSDRSRFQSKPGASLGLSSLSCNLGAT